MVETFPYEILTCGQLAERAFACGSKGLVRAVFERSFYIEMRHEDHVCVGIPEIGHGPLNVIIRPHFSLQTVRPWPNLDDTAELNLGLLWLQKKPFARWVFPHIAAPPIPVLWSAESLQAGLAELMRLASKSAPEESLFALCRDGTALRSLSPSQQHAVAATLHIGDVVAQRGQLKFRADIISSLLGLGPGLTPSGDDLLMGTLIALRFLQLDSILEDLWSIVAVKMNDRTHSISRSHLRAAARGHCAPPLEATLRCLAEGDDVNLGVAIQGAAKLGHTSGWDFLTGIVIVLRGFDARLHAVLP